MDKEKISKFLLVFITLFMFWLLLVSSFRFNEIFVGVISSLIVAYITYNLLIYGGVKDKLNPKKWFWAIIYFFYYWFYAEVKAHVDVIKRILHPKMPIKPGIVKVPYTMQTDFGIVCVANSITNTPGTVTIEVDESEKCYYVHWIWVVSPEPKICHEEIISGFEKYVKRFLG